MSRPERKSQYLVNVPLLIATVIGCALVAVAGHFWHAQQINGTAVASFDRAKELLKDGKFDEAVRYLYQYTQIRPEDAEGYIELAHALTGSGSDLRARARAISPLRRAVGLAPDELKARQDLAQLLLETGQYAEAISQAKLIVDATKDATNVGTEKASKSKQDPHELNLEANQILALATYFEAAQGSGANWTMVAKEVKVAADRNAKDIKVASCLAEILRTRPVKAKLMGLSNPEGLDDSELVLKAADDAMNATVEANQSSAPSLLARYQYRKRFKLAGADEDLDAALRSAPRDPEVVLSAAERAAVRAADRALDRAARQRQWEQARSLFTIVTEVSPSDRRGFLGLAQTQIELEDRDGALATLRAGMDKSKRADIFIGWRLADLLIDTRDFAAADKVIKDVSNVIQSEKTAWRQNVLESMNAETSFIRARWWFEQGKAHRAAQILAKLAITKPMPIDGQRYVVSPLQATRMLAAVFANLGQWDQAADAFEVVLATAPQLDRVRAAAAQARLMAGQSEAALKHLEILRSQGKETASDELMHAQAMLQRQMKRPSESRDLTELRKELDRAFANGREKSGWEWLAIRADYEIANGDSAAAFASLQAAEQGFPKSESCLRTVAFGYERLGKAADADRVFDDWQALAADKTDALIARAANLTSRGQEEDAVALLKGAVDSASEPNRLKIRHQQVQMLVRKGELKPACEALAALSAANPENLRWLIELAELSLQCNSPETTEKCEQRLKNELEGESGTWWRYFRCRRLLAARGENREALLNEAQGLARELEVARPMWPEGQMLQGLIAEKQGDPARAIAAYRQVLQLDDGRVPAYERLIQLLISEQQFVEARKVLAQLQDRQNSSRASHFAIALSLQKDDLAAAQGEAKAWIKTDPNDPLAHIWLAQTYLLKGENANAEAEIRKATELAPTNYRAWAPLVLFYVQTKQPEQVRKTLKQIEKQVDLPGAAKASMLGQSYELIGDLADAERFYKQADQLAPNDPSVKERLTSFLVRSQGPQADEALKKLGLTADNSPTRRIVAESFLKKGDQKSLSQAIDLLSHDESDAKEAAQNNRLKAKLLLNRNGPDDHDQAIKTLTTLVRETRFAAPQDRLLLAGLLEAKDRVSAARQEYEALVNAPKAEPMHWAVYADFLLRRNFPREAATWIRRLEEKQPDSLATISLKARLLQQDGHPDQIEALVEAAAERLQQDKSSAEKAQIKLAVGQIYIQVGEREKALKHLREAYKLAPAAYGPLIVALVQSKEFDEAITICQKATTDQSTSVAATTLANAFVGAGATPQEMQLAEPLFATVLRQHGDDVQFLMALVGVRYFEGKYEDVINLSRRVLAKEPNNVLAMNNLASLLLEGEHRAEALQIIDRAIKLGGRLPTLLDTKAVALLYERQFNESVELLKEAIASAPNDARMQLHLASAYRGLGDTKQAIHHLKLAQAAKLSLPLLTPSEKDLLDKLLQLSKENPTL